LIIYCLLAILTRIWIGRFAWIFEISQFDCISNIWKDRKSQADACTRTNHPKAHETSPRLMESNPIQDSHRHHRTGLMSRPEFGKGP
jgi:hypothetical protein